jgi:hypothetical protein
MGNNLAAARCKLRDKGFGEPPVIVRALIVKHGSPAGVQAVESEIRADNALERVNKACSEDKIPNLGYPKSCGGRRYNNNPLLLGHGSHCQGSA